MPLFEVGVVQCVIPRLSTDLAKAIAIFYLNRSAKCGIGLRVEFIKEQISDAAVSDQAASQGTEIPELGTPQARISG